MKILKDQPLVEASAQLREYIENSEGYSCQHDLRQSILLPLLDIIDILIAGVTT